jgi:hypothetical protein
LAFNAVRRWTSIRLDLEVAADRDRAGHCEVGRCRGMKVLAADGYILCRGLLRTLMLLHDGVCITAADSIDEILARITRAA